MFGVRFSWDWSGIFEVDVLGGDDKVFRPLAHFSPERFPPSMESQKRIDRVLSPGFLFSFTGSCPP